jgi:hypothetical protein
MDDPAWAHYWLLLLLLLLKKQEQWERDTAWLLSGKHPMSRNRSSFCKVDTTPCLPKDGCVFFPMEAHETHGAFINEQYIVVVYRVATMRFKKWFAYAGPFVLEVVYIFTYFLYIFSMNLIFFFRPKLS